MNDRQPHDDAILSEGENWACERDERGRWVSTSGRPPNSRNKLTKKSARAITDLHDLAFQKLAELLKAGHPGIVEFTIRSLLPSGGRAVQLDDLSAESLIGAVAEGVISPVEMRQIAVALEKIKNVSELDEMKARMLEIERLLKDESL